MTLNRCLTVLRVVLNRCVTVLGVVLNRRTGLSLAYDRLLSRTRLVW